MKRRMKQPEKLNLIPILDAVFIFIFFLLMSAQFVQIHEIRTDRPLVKDVSEKKDKTPPLNLTLKVTQAQIKVITGLEEKVVKQFNINKEDSKYLDDLNKLLGQIKTKHPKETTIIIKPDRRVKYAQIIKIVDHSKWLVADNSINRELFSNVIFESN